MVTEAVLDLVQYLNVRNISALPEAWQFKIDDTWCIAVNGHNYDETVKPDGCMEIELPPFHIAVWYNGWLAGLFHPSQGGQFADGSGANQETFVAAICAATDSEMPYDTAAIAKARGGE